MVCCVVAALMVLVIHRLMPWRVGSDDGGFAPMAVRPAPVERRRHVGSGQSVAWLTRRDAARSWTARFATLAIAAYLLGAGILVVSDAAADTGAAGFWVLRSAVLAVLALLLLRVSIRVRRSGCDPSTRREIAGYACLAAGVTFLALMIIDMHVVHLYHVHIASLHTAMQGLPLVAVFTGMLLVARPRLPATPIPRTRGGAPNLG